MKKPIVAFLRRPLVTGSCAAAVLGPALPASASAPEQITAARNEVVSFTIDCGDFVAEGSGLLSNRFIIYFDEAGNVTRWTEFVSAPADLWTNPETGKTIRVRGHFTQFQERIPGTDEFTRTVTGFRYIVNQPGSGVVIQEVGRIVYDHLDESTWHYVAGQHDFADGSAVEPGICAALA